MVNIGEPNQLQAEAWCHRKKACGKGYIESQLSRDTACEVTRDPALTKAHAYLV